MADIRIQQVRTTTIEAPQLSQAQVQRRIALHTTDTVERITSVKTDKGRISLPTVDPQQAAGLQQLYAMATPEQQQGLVEASHQLAVALYNEPPSAPGSLASASSGMTSAVNTAMQQVVDITGSNSSSDSVLSNTMHMAVDGATQDLYDLANQLQGSLNAAQQTRTDIADFRNALADWPDGQTDETFTYTTYDSSGNPIVHKDVSMDQATAQQTLSNLEDQLQGQGSTTQMFQLQVQDAMQKQQQAYETLSGILKAFNDTAKAIIGNLHD